MYTFFAFTFDSFPSVDMVMIEAQQYDVWGGGEEQMSASFLYDVRKYEIVSERVQKETNERNQCFWSNRLFY